MLGLFFGRESEKRIIGGQKKIMTMVQRWGGNSDQLSDEIQSGRKENYVKKVYPDIKEEKRKKEIFLNISVEKKIKIESKDTQRAVKNVLRRLTEGIYSSSIKKLSKGKFYVCRIGSYRLIFEEKEGKILVVDFVKRSFLPKALKEISISNV